MNQLPILVLKVCPCVGESLCSLCLPNGFGRGAESNLSTSHIFSLSVLAATLLVGGKAEDGGEVGPELGVSSSFFHAQWLSQPYQRQDWVQVGFIPFKCVHSP